MTPVPNHNRVRWIVLFDSTRTGARLWCNHTHLTPEAAFQCAKRYRREDWTRSVEVVVSA